MDTLTRNQNIKKEYERIVAQPGATPDDALDALVKKFSIGKFYVRSILISHFKIKIPRKSRYNREDRTEMTGRNKTIAGEFRGGQPVDKLAKKHGLTTMRIKQLLRSELGETYGAALAEIKKMVHAGKSYADVQAKFGAAELARIEVVCGYRVRQEVVRHHRKRIIAMHVAGKTPQQIADAFDTTRDTIYVILRGAGIRIKVAQENKHERDVKILGALSEGKSLTEVAALFGLGTAAVRNICRDVITEAVSSGETVSTLLVRHQGSPMLLRQIATIAEDKKS